MSTKLRCKHCRHPIAVPRDAAESSFRCPQCKKRLKIARREPKTKPPVAANDQGWDWGEIAQMADSARALHERLTVSCPDCGTAIETSTKFLNRRIECPDCGKRVKVTRPKRAVTTGKTGGSDAVPWAHLYHRNRHESNLSPRRRRLTGPAWKTAGDGLQLAFYGGVVIAGTFGILFGTAIGSIVLAVWGMLAGGLLFGAGVGLISIAFFAARAFQLVVALWEDHFKEIIGLTIAVVVMVVLVTTGQAVALAGASGLAFLSVLGACVLVLVGWLKCLAVPKESGAKGPLLASVVVLGICMASIVVTAVLGVLDLLQASAAFQPGSLVLAGAGLCLILATVAKSLFTFFVRAVARHANDEHGTEQATVYLVYQGVFLLLLAIVGGLVMGGNQQLPIAVILFSLALLLDAILFSQLVSAARGAIR